MAKLLSTGNVSDIKLKDNPTEIVGGLKARYPSLILIDPNEILCRDGLCDVQIDGTFIYGDHSHLNRLGSRLLGEKYLKAKGNPLTGLAPWQNPEPRRADSQSNPP
jgi:hypothetical protein